LSLLIGKKLNRL